MDEYMRNVIQLGVGFFFIFCAFNSQGFIEQTVISRYANASHRGGIEDYDGYTSLSITYASFTAANFISAPIVEFLNARWAMVFGGLAYALFQVGFLHLNRIYLLLSSAVLGIGAAVIWTAQGKCLTLNSTEQTASRHSGIFWAISQACLIVGGIFLSIVFHSSSSISDSSVQLIYGIFTAITVLGIVILALLRLPSPASASISHADAAIAPEQSLTHLQVIMSTLTLAKTTPMILLSVASAYTGVELSFWSGIYPTCIMSTSRLGSNTASLLALNAITQGVGQASSGFLFGILSSRTKRLGRPAVILLGALVHLLTFGLIFINFPTEAPLGPTEVSGIIEPNVVLALLAGFLLGFGDAMWNTQIFAHLIAKYPKQSAQAFSLFKFFQSLFTSAAFYYSKSLGLHWHLLILVIGLFAGATGFIMAEKLHTTGPEDTTIQHHDD